MRFFTYTEKGFHHENEDSIQLITHPENDEILIAVLCDGQGGRSGGKDASNEAVRFSIEIAEKTSHLQLLKPFVWADIGSEVDKKVLEFQDAGFTTYIGLGIGKNFVAGASCGDSAVLLLNGNKFVFLTEGQIKHPAIGSGLAKLRPFSARLDDNWKILLMSDGVWKFIELKALETMASEQSGNELIIKLKEEIENRFHELPDDFSIILVES